MKHLQDNELKDALRILHGPPQLASPDQARNELPPLFKSDSQPTPQRVVTHPDPTHVQQIKANIEDILRHHPKHRGAGPAGERYEHYAIVYKNPAALTSSTDTLTLLATNQVPEETLNAVASARIIPLIKPNGKIRPIACGTVLRRIVAAAVTKHITPMIAKTINPHQYAIGKANGAEELHKYTQARLDQDKNTAILSIDIAAAFSDVHHSAVLTAIQTHHPDLEPLLRPWITAQARYLCNLGSETLTLTSPRGVPMGCPLAAAAFALTLHTALAKIDLELTQTEPTTTITAYMDDINILTRHQFMPQALTAIERNLNALGLQLNSSKTECWVHPSTVPLAPQYYGIKRTSRPIVLKSAAQPMPTIPEGPNQTQFLKEQAPEYQRLLDKRTATATRIKQLHAQGLSTHVAQALWRTATASDATFTARTLGLDTTVARKLDQMTIDLWQEWLNTPLTTQDITRIFSSISNHGLGFTSATHIKDAALIASWAQTAPSILHQMKASNMGVLLDSLPYTKAQLQAAVDKVDPALWATLAEITPDTPIPRHQQKKLATIVRAQQQVSYTNQLNATDMSAYLSTGGTGAGTWLHAPTQDIKPLTNTHFTIATKLRLNKHQVPLATHNCLRSTDARTCNKPNNPQMHHAL